MERNVSGWFEIPVENINRAVEFYTKLFGFEMQAKDFGDNGDEMAMFPMDFTKDLPGAGGCLYKEDGRKPSKDGTLIYFTSPSEDCKNEEEKAKEIGATVIKPKTEIPDGHGNFTIIEDSEGNHIAIHSMK